MKRYLIPLALAAFASALVLAPLAQTMRSVNDTNELCLLNPRSINTNVFVHSIPPLKGSVWTWMEGDTTGPDTNHLDSVLYPGLGRWVWNQIGTNYYETLIVSNLVASGDSQWTNKAGILQPINLTLPVMITNQLQFGPGTTNYIARTNDVDIVYNAPATIGNSSGIFIRRGSGDPVYFAETSAGGALVQSLANRAILDVGGVQVFWDGTSFQPAALGANLGNTSASTGGWNNLYLTNQIIFGPGTTNVFYRTTDDLTYTNGQTAATGVGINIMDGNNGGVRVSSRGNVATLEPATGSATTYVQLRDSSSRVAKWVGARWLPGSSGYSVGGAGWGNLWDFWGTNYYTEGFSSGTGYSRLQVYQPGTNQPVIFDQQTTGEAGYSRGFSFRTNGVEVFNVTGTGGPSSAANWVANGATDSDLAGTASAGSATVTNTLTVASTIKAAANLLETPELYTGSFKLYRGALTPVDAGVSLDFGSTNRYWSISLTGAVTFATANLVAGKHANVMITGVATNAAYTWPAGWIFIGYKPTYLTANKHADLYLKATSGADAGVWAFYGEEQ